MNTSLIPAIQEHDKVLDEKLCFSLDALPADFGSYIPHPRDEIPRHEVNVAMQKLTEMIWSRGGYRFINAGMSGGHQTFNYNYKCCQDEKRAREYKPTVEEEKQRYPRRMYRLPCESTLYMRACLRDRTLTVSIRHKRHDTYVDSAVKNGKIRRLMGSEQAGQTNAGSPIKGTTDYE